MDEKNLDSMAYAFKGRIMISSVVLLFLACLVIVLFHVFARCCSRHRLNHHNRRRHYRSTAATVISSNGLDLSAINSLPYFIYESKSQGSPLECAVCLSEFEDDEAGRVLPECNHCFHVDCIDMWLQSHCDCPLCRCRVMGQPGVIRAESVGNPVDGAVSVIVPEDMSSGSDSGLNRIPESEGIRLGGASRELIGPMEQSVSDQNWGGPGSDSGWNWAGS